MGARFSCRLPGGAAPLRRLSSVQPGGSLAPQRPAAPSSAPVVTGEKHLGGGLVLALPGLRALEKAAVPPCLPHQPVPAALGRWGPGGFPFTRHLHLESVTWKIYGGITNNSPGSRGLGLFGEGRKGNGMQTRQNGHQSGPCRAWRSLNRGWLMSFFNLYLPLCTAVLYLGRFSHCLTGHFP